MSKKRPLEIFRAGTHITSGGDQIAFAESDLAASASAYDPALHEAPLVVGHPRHDAPAYGWVEGLAAEGGALLAAPRQVDAAFAEMVGAGRFKKISASFYRPDSPSNPVPGVYYLRHVGFLGAQPPAVKGLVSAEFAGSDADCVTVEFEEALLGTPIARLFRSLREWIVEKFGREEADKALDGYRVDWLQEDAAQAAAESDTAFGEEDHQPGAAPAKQENPMDRQKSTPAEPGDAALAKRVADLEAREAAFAERQARQEATEIIDKAVASGLLTPATASGLAEFAASLPNNEADAVSFGEAEQKLTPRRFFFDFLGRLPKAVDFGELSAEDGRSPHGLTPADMAMRAVAFQEGCRRDGLIITTTEAVQAVKEGKDRE